MQPGVERNRTFEAAQSKDRLPYQLNRVDEVLLARLVGVLGGCDQELVRATACGRCEKREAASKGDVDGPVTQDLADPAARSLEPRQLIGHGRGRFAEPEELRVTVREACTSLPALVEHDMDVGEPFRLCRLPPRVES